MATSDGDEARPGRARRSRPGRYHKDRHATPRSGPSSKGIVLHHPEESNRSPPPTRAQARIIDCGAKIPQMGTFPSVRQRKADGGHELCDANQPASTTGEY